MSKRISKGMEQIIIREYNKGREVGNIAACYDVGHTTVYDILKRNGIKPSRRPKKEENVSKPVFDFTEHIGPHDALCVQDEFEYSKLAKILDEENFKWEGGEKYTEWSPYGRIGQRIGDPCYIWYNMGFYGAPEDVRYTNFKVFNFADYDWSAYGFKPKFRIENFPGKYVMHCPEEWQAKIFCKYLDSTAKCRRDRMPCSNEKIKKLWSMHKQDTCYNFKLRLYSRIEYYIERNYKILEFSDFDWSEYDKPESELVHETTPVQPNTALDDIDTNCNALPDAAFDNGEEDAKQPYVKPVFDFNAHKDKNNSIHVKNESEFKRLAKILDKRGYKWNSGKSYVNGWTPYKDTGVITLKPEDSGYIFYRSGLFGTETSKIFTDKDFEFSDYDWSEYENPDVPRQIELMEEHTSNFAGEERVEALEKAVKRISTCLLSASAAIEDISKGLSTSLTDVIITKDNEKENE